VTDAGGIRLDPPFERNLWATNGDPGQVRAIVPPVDPTDVDIDAHALL
jgi:hypothetical protein